MRLNRYLASCGLGSRRSCETLIREARVAINGEICTDLSTRVQPGDDVTCDDRRVAQKEVQVVILHKPLGFTTSSKDEGGRKTVLLSPSLVGLHAADSNLSHPPRAAMGRRA